MTKLYRRWRSAGLSSAAGTPQRGYLWLLLAVLWTAFVWSNSLRTAQESSGQSSQVLGLLEPLLSWLHIDSGIQHTLVRKLAHMGEFGVLGMFWWGFFTHHCRRWSAAVTAAALCLGTAVTDELLQLLSEGRSCQAGDIVIDMLGAAAVISAAVLAAGLWGRRSTESR